MSETTVARTTKADGRASLVTMCIGRVGIEMRQFFRERDAVIFVFAFPIVMLVIFASAFSSEKHFIQAGPVSITAAQYYLTGMIATGIMLTSFQNLAIFIATERDDGTLKRLRGTPMPAIAYFVGKIVQVIITTAIQIILLLAVARLSYSVGLPDSTGMWWRFGWLVVLGTAAGTTLGIAFSSVPRSGRSASAVVTPIVLILQFISGVYFPYNNLPGWMHAIASVFPLKWMAQGIRSVFLPPEMVKVEPGQSWQLGTGAIMLAVWLVIGLVLAARTFRWLRRDDG